MHYSDSLELSVYCNVEGRVTVEQSSWEFSGNSILVIPPNCIHSVFLKKSPGHVYILHVSFKHLKAFVDIEKMLAFEGIEIQNYRKKNHIFNAVLDHIKNMIDNDNNIFRRISELLLTFDELSSCTERKKSILLTKPAQSNSLLHVLIEWTEDNYSNNLLSLDDAAGSIGLSKNYFCTWFKKLTGITYNTYLNDVRIAKACSSLYKTLSATKTCSESGFSDLSYFVQVFRKRVGITPYRYIEAHLGKEMST
jgi:xylan 1,4-beta-xylosidase